MQQSIKMPKKQSGRRDALRREERAARMKKLQTEDVVDLVSENSAPQEHNFPTQHSIARPPPAGPLQTETCLMCLDQHFEAGRYILDCAHSFCSDCIHYWEAVSDLCPVCHLRSKSILSVYCGESRVKAVGFAPVVPACGKCGSDRHYHLMYYCDECNQNCVHIYCEPSLQEENRGERWVCEHCIYSNYYENRYNEDSASEEVQEVQEVQEVDDSFVVDDDVVEYISESDALDVEDQPTARRNRNTRMRGRENVRRGGEGRRGEGRGGRGGRA